MHQIRKFSILTKMQLGNKLPATPSEADGSHHLECSFPCTSATPEITECCRMGSEDEWKARHDAELHLAASYWWFGQCSSAHLRKFTGRSPLMTYLYPAWCCFASIYWASFSLYDSKLKKKKKEKKRILEKDIIKHGPPADLGIIGVLDGKEYIVQIVQ